MAEPDFELGPDEISAGPTKTFFVSMITRDIELIPAIVDLVDNSVDGARDLRGEGSLDGLYVELECTHEEFVIRDNCGGIPIDVARKYAFRFGRDKDTPGVAHSVGQFGVGMKRALFKLGNHFTVDSVASDSRFSLDVNVPKWADEPDWVFPLPDHDDHFEADVADTGTTIHVKELHEDVSKAFALEKFVASLSDSLATTHRISISRGLRISVSGVDIRADPLTILSSETIAPGKRAKRYDKGLPAPVEVVLVAGLGSSEPQQAGWYVFCNSRLVVDADQTNLTGWGEGRGRKIPRFHTQFSRFRGFAFFDSDRTDLLPLTTTKVGVDKNSRIWRATRIDMIEMTRPVIDFLNLIDWERPQVGQGNVGALEQAVDRAVPALVFDVPESPFHAPARDDIEPPEKWSSIQYSQPVDLIDRAKALLEVSTNADVGVRTFEYYLEAEDS